MTGTNPDKSYSHRRLSKYLDTLPAGYPPSESGVEIDLLKKLFTKEEAALALHLRLINEPPGVIARRANLPAEQVGRLLDDMAHKGLIAAQYKEQGSARYAIHQFVIGFWEGQVDRLDQEAVRLFEAYAPTWFAQGTWKTFPQVRTIPIKEAIPITTEVMAYEQAESILRSKSLIAVQNCICRQEGALLGHACGKPMETCLSFDNAAKSTIANGRGRKITLEEAFDLIEQAQDAGLVLQPANSQNPIFMCACCDCCCGVLQQIKKEPNPASLVMNAFVATQNKALCIDCASCVEICPMAALSETTAGMVSLNPERCIGCGLCASRCPTGAISMARKPRTDRTRIPGNTTGTYLRLAAKRGLGTLALNAWLMIKAWYENRFFKG